MGPVLQKLQEVRMSELALWFLRGRRMGIAIVSSSGGDGPGEASIAPRTTGSVATSLCTAP
jgi:hypothetical protein